VSDRQALYGVQTPRIVIAGGVRHWTRRVSLTCSWCAKLAGTIADPSVDVDGTWHDATFAATGRPLGAMLSVRVLERAYLEVVKANATRPPNNYPQDGYRDALIEGDPGRQLPDLIGWTHDCGKALAVPLSRLLDWTRIARKRHALEPHRVPKSRG